MIKKDITYDAVCTGLQWFSRGQNEEKEIISPADGLALGHVRLATKAECDEVIAASSEAFLTWRSWPAPKRGEVVRCFGNLLREHKRELGTVVSLEMGKILQEGMGEVQEMIDVCDFAVGLSRQLYGLTIASERPGHRMMEQYLPLGSVAVISAYNFPVAVWSWNAMIAAVCGDTVIWKPSERTPLTAVACMQLLGKAIKACGVPEGVFNLILGDGKTIGSRLANDRCIKLVSFTGSTAVGKEVNKAVAARLGRSLLELGGNNAVIVTPGADMRLVLPAVVFGAAGTAGQRCTTIRRLIVHEDIFDTVSAAVASAYKGLRVGDPLDESVHVGPVSFPEVAEEFYRTLNEAKAQGGEILAGGEAPEYAPTPCYVRPAVIKIKADAPILQEERFCPVLYLIPYGGGVENAVAIQNDAAHGLSSAIFSTDLRETEAFLSAAGSDCGIANVNIGTSGAEIGGAFGGEKDTGGGRESGSDAWKAYMRRQTCTINYSNELPLAQGIEFKI